MIRALAVIGLLATPMLAQAQALDAQLVAPDVWAIVGETEQRSAENLANNATFGLVVTPNGAVLIDPGGSYNGAAALHAAIQTVTDTPVTHVINTGGQDHRWLGNGYWHSVGATIIASTAAVADHHARASEQMGALAQFLGDGLHGTDPTYADVTFDTDYTLTLGGMDLHIMHRGPAHTLGDAFVWLPQRDVMFTGDIVYVDRILGTGPAHNVQSWINVFAAMAAFNPAHIIPGHGRPTDLATAQQQTYDYLVNLRSQIGALIADGGDIIAAPSIDQSAWSGLEQFDSLAGRNAQATFEQMEWE